MRQEGREGEDYALEVKIIISKVLRYLYIRENLDKNKTIRKGIRGFREAKWKP